MAKKAKKVSAASFKVRVVYGFLNKLEIILLGDIISGKIEEGMHMKTILPHQTPVGSWKIKEVLKMDFINGNENQNFIGLVIHCKNEDDFKLLQSLRVYDETVVIQ